ncbi:MAG TPA: ABC transporter permease subunit [Planctomycetaceae bacterium]|nr:ABC transporter permease subunit [Planctomycetaceae bacterium]
MRMKAIPLGLPLLTRELQEQAVRRRTYVIRVVYAILLFSVAYCLFYDLLQNSSTIFSALGYGRQMLAELLALQFAGVYIFMPAVGATAIAVEKERSTFGLLLLTRLSPWTIVFEKLLSRMVPMLSFLLLGLPLLGFAYTLGGVQTDELMVSGIGLGIALLQTASLALFCSAFCRTTTGALIAAYLLQVLLMFGPPLIVATNVGGIETFLDQTFVDDAEWVFFAPAMTNLWANGGAMGVMSIGGIAGIVLHSLAYAPLAMLTLLLLVATRLVIVRRAFALPKHRLQKLFRSLDGLFKRWNNNRFTRGILLTGESAELPESQPVAWIETTRTALGSLRYLVRLLLVVETLLAVLLLLIANSGGDGETETLLSMIVFLVWMGAVALVAIKGASLIAGERSRQTLDVLLTMPISARELIAEKLTGLRRLMIVVSVPLLTLFLFQAWWRALPMTGQLWMDQRRLLPSLYLTSAISCMVLYLHGAAWMSIVIGLRSRSQTRAVLQSLGLIVAACIGPLLLMFIAEVMFDLSEKSPVYWFFIASPMMSVAMNEFNAFGQMYREPWLAVALNAAYYGAWWIGLRVWCLRRAPVWLGRTCETVVAEEAAAQT